MRRVDAPTITTTASRRRRDHDDAIFPKLKFLRDAESAREQEPDRHEELVVPLDLGAPAEFVLRQHGLDGRGLGLAAPLRPRRRRRLALARRRLRVPHRDVVVGIEVRIDLVRVLVVGGGVLVVGSLLVSAERESRPRAPRAAAAPAPRDDARGDGGLEGALLLAVVVACVEINPLSRFSATTWPRWLRRAVRNRHRYAIEQIS